MKPLTPTTPHVIILVGIPGAGKTTFAEHFAKTFHAPYINTAAIESKVGITPEASIKVTELFFEELLKTGRTFIYEGATSSKEERAALAKYVAKAGYKHLTVWVQTEPLEAKRRSLSKQKVDRISSATFDERYTAFVGPTAIEKPVVISGKHTYVTQLRIVLKRLSVARPATPPSATPPPVEPRVYPGRNITIR